FGEPLPASRRWCDALVVRRFPVTNRDYLAFLDADPAHAAFVPRDRSDTLGAAGPPLMERGPDGRFALRPDEEGDLWLPDWPVLMVDLPAAAAFARWRAAVDGLPWRLPDELEWEKAARGVDGRAFPWGDWLDPTWARHLRSVPGRKMPVAVTDYPIDRSVYGVRCVAGTVQEWTSSTFRTDGPISPDGKVVPELLGAEIPLDPDHLRTVRGGHWYGPPALCRCASRLATEPANRAFHLGFRLVRSYSEPTTEP
ncbi:MAG: SUMF1/EgtB/PvdO family nonheme iron enzyme, partial [Myxococcota bacterium]